MTKKQHSELLTEILKAGSPENAWEIIERNLKKIDAHFFEVVATEICRCKDEGDDDSARVLLLLPIGIAGVRVSKKHEREWIAADKTLAKAHQLLQQQDTFAARRELDEAIILYRRIGHIKGEADALALLGHLHEMTSELQQALKNYQDAADKYHGHGLWEFEGKALGRAGDLLKIQGKNADARGYYRRQLDCASTIMLKEQEAEAHFGIGICFLHEKQFENARSHLELALTLGTTLSDLILQANANANLGIVFLEEGKTSSATAYLTRAESLFRETGLSEGVKLVTSLLARSRAGNFIPSQAPANSEALALEQQAIQAKERGDIQAALTLRERALELARQSGDLLNTVVLTGNIGNIYRENLSNLETALDYFQRALEIARQIAAPQLQAWLLKTIGETNRELGLLKEALHYFQAAIEAAETAGDEDMLFSVLIAAGNEMKYANRSWEAFPYYERALKITEQTNNNEGRVLALGNLGNVKEQIDDMTTARQLYEQGLQLAKQIGYTQGIMNQSNNLGSIHRRLGEYQAAIDLFKQAFGAGLQLGNSEYQAAALKNMALAFEESRQLEKALECLDKSIELMQAEPRIDWMPSFYRSRAEIKRVLKQYDASENDWKLACQWLERIADMQFKSQQDLRVYENLAKHYWARISTAIANGRFKDGLEQLEEIKSKPLRSFSGNKSPDLSQMLELLRRYDKTTAIVHYGVLDEAVVAWVLRSDLTTVGFEKLPATIEDINNCMQRFLQEVDKHAPQPDLDETWQEIASNLVEPLIDKLAGCNLVYLSPHSMLWYLPLHAIRVRGKPLLTYFPIVYIDSIARLAMFQFQPQRSRKSCLSVGVGITAIDDPTFCGEAQIAARAFNTNAYIGQEVTRQLLLDEMSGKDVIHISAHGEIGNNGAEIILCNESERIKPKDIERCKILANLVLLSGCDTGWLDHHTLIVGAHGLWTEFLNAGAASVISANWAISSSVSLQIVAGFYQYLSIPGISKAEALQRAQLDILKKPHYHGHTYYWAPFSIIGDYF